MKERVTALEAEVAAMKAAIAALTPLACACAYARGALWHCGRMKLDATDAHERRTPCMFGCGGVDVLTVRRECVDVKPPDRTKVLGAY